MTVFPTNLTDGEFIRAKFINELCRRNNTYIEKDKSCGFSEETLCYTNNLIFVLIPLIQFRQKEFNFQKAMDHLVHSIDQLLESNSSIEQKIRFLKRAVSILTIVTNRFEKLNSTQFPEPLTAEYKDYISVYMRELEALDKIEANFDDNIMLTKSHLLELSKNNKLILPIRQILHDEVLELDKFSVVYIPKDKRRFFSKVSMHDSIEEDECQHQETDKLLAGKFSVK